MRQCVGLYVHFPFCLRKCRYCSFVSYSYDQSEAAAYVAALRKELNLRGDGQKIGSIFLGGGTPSLLSVSQLGEILREIRSRWDVENGVEVTMEVNPGTVDVEYLAAARAMGVNRLSLGIQSFNDVALALLGRMHTAAQGRDAMGCARGAGFANVNLDLMYGLPGQTVQDWQDTLNEAVGMRPEHLSLYALSLEEDTPLYAALQAGGLPGIDPDLCADQYELAEDLLEGQGYQHYEISNWARDGRECRHNIACWVNAPYLGFGVAAHSSTVSRRTANTHSLGLYGVALSQGALPPAYSDEAIGPELRLAESVILGLRLCSGIDVGTFESRCGTDLFQCYGTLIEELVGVGLLERCNGHLRLTRRGRLLSNEVFWRFLPG